MKDYASLHYENGSFEISGELNFKTTVRLWEKSLPLIKQHYDLRFDFSKVKSSNSAGLALMLAWVKFAKQSRKAIHFHHIPTQLNSIIAVAGVGKLLDSLSS